VPLWLFCWIAFISLLPFGVVGGMVAVIVVLMIGAKVAARADDAWYEADRAAMFRRIEARRLNP
jgi:hypothetical protein